MRRSTFASAVLSALILAGLLIASGEATILSSADERLVEELKAARRSGDLAKVTEIMDILSPSERRAERIEPLIHPEVGFAPLQNSTDDRLWGNDVLVVDTEYLEGATDMVSSSSGELFLVVEHADDFSMRIYRSSDGGSSWLWYQNFYSYDYDILEPALTVPENDEDYLYVIYELSTLLQVARIDLLTDEITYHNVEVNEGGVHRPRIVTDNIDYPGNYWLYVIYIANDPNNPILTYDIKAARSMDNGETWGAFEIFNSQSFNFNSEVDITFGGGIVYATWDAWETLTTYGVYLSRSSTLGMNWDPWLNLTPTDRGCSSPRVGAINAGQAVVVAYQDSWALDDKDIRLAYSQDGGDTWTKESCIDCSYDDTRSPDICVDPNLGDFHVGYWRENDTMYSHAFHSDPTSWTPGLVINDTNQSSFEFSPPTMAVEWNLNEVAIAWTDERTATRAIYFDRVGLSTATDQALPAAFSLGRNYPNPFNPSTTIGYALPTAALVTLRIFDVSGRGIRDLVVGETQPAGSYEVVWDGRSEMGAPVASGVYFYELEAGAYRETQRMILLK